MYTPQLSLEGREKFIKIDIDPNFSNEIKKDESKVECKNECDLT